MATEDRGRVKLYWLEQSRSQRIVWLLEELGVPYELEIFHRDKQTMLAPPELEKIHPLGKSPVIGVWAPGAPADSEPAVVVAESGNICEYLVDHFGKGTNLEPPRWKDGMEGKVGGETESWLRYRYYMHYAEGSLMPNLVMGLVIGRLKSPMVPFLIRPITSVVANKIMSSFIFPNAKKNLAFLNDQLKTSGGKFLCGDKLTAADILMSFPLVATGDRFNTMGTFEGGSWDKAYPEVKKYITMINECEGYKRSIAKIEAVDGKFQASL